LLGISRDTVYGMMARHEIAGEEWWPTDVLQIFSSSSRASEQTNDSWKERYSLLMLKVIEQRPSSIVPF
jgi:hypothetical protein